MAENLDLFTPQAVAAGGAKSAGQRAPLADRMRPHAWADFEGLELIDQNLVTQLQEGQGRAPSLVLWGPPGTGKTTLARLIGRSFDCHFVEFSAVLGGVKEVREIIKQARKIPQQTVLFVDEIHRFNKAQQDAFLPHIENGIIVLIGATTENPSFYLNSALLSRARVVPLTPLSDERLGAIVCRACDELHCGLEPEARQLLVKFVGGDARRLLNLIEGLRDACSDTGSEKPLFSREVVEQFLGDANTSFYDRDGEEHYNMASAFIKSMRGSDPDAALYWGLRMIESGEDPRFVLRRMIIFASEDIGNADPRALQLAVSAYDAFEKIGLPEGKIPLSHCITYLASAPKSNRSYLAMKAAAQAIRENPRAVVPAHLRNAPTELMKDLGYGAGYSYPHDFESGYVTGVQYLPDERSGDSYYNPSDIGFERRIKELRELQRKVSRS